MKHTTLLKRGGFKRVGCWGAVEAIDEIGLDGVVPAFPGVYAYVVDGTVCYVGSAQRGLSNRMRHYARTKSMRTAFRVRQLIRGVLAQGSVVEVFILVPSGEDLHYAGLPVDVIAGVEEGLIRHLRPAWNIRGLGLTV